MEDLYDPEELILCPYNSAHRIRRCKMSFHLVKCKVSYGEQRMVPCDFNATHMIPEPERQYHHQICPDRKKIEARIVESRTKTENKFPIPNIEVESEENWDDYNTPSYNPEEYTVNNDVIRHLDVASGAKRRNFRLEERQRLSQLNSQGQQPSGGPRAQDAERVRVAPLPTHRPVTEYTENRVPNRSQLKESLRRGANKVYLNYDERN